MVNIARWRNWRPSGLPARKEPESASKPTKPSELPAAAANQAPEAIQRNLFEPTGVISAGSIPPVIAGIGEFMAEITAFARIGSEATLTAAPDSVVSFEGFEGFEGFEPRRNGRIFLRAETSKTGALVIRPQVVPSGPAPTGFKTVVAGYGREQVRYTAMRHRLSGANRFGQDGLVFPACLLNLGSWRDDPFDLRLVPWYRSEEEAIYKYAPRVASLHPDADVTACTASFSGGIQIELRCESRSRWLMWELRGGRIRRRVDFASPSLRHAKETAICWYGEPVSEWVDITAIAAKANPARRRT
jgi:hypothetical protein